MPQLRRFLSALKPTRLGVFFAVLVALGFYAMMILNFGRPINILTWIVVFLPLVVGLPFLFVPKMKVVWFVFPAFFLVYLYFFSSGEWLLDIQTGCLGKKIMPGIAFFTHRGENTDLIKEFLGDLEPYWCYGGLVNPGNIRDADERVNSRSLVFRTDLREIIDLLPSVEAKRKVLKCISNPQNQLRLHQGMLLVCLRILGFPKGMSSQDWWTANEFVFIEEPDGKKCAAFVQGWGKKIEDASMKRLRQLTDDEKGEINSQLHAAREKQTSSDFDMPSWKWWEAPDPKSIGSKMTWWE